jgi:hypothetical protein
VLEKRSLKMLNGNYRSLEKPNSIVLSSHLLNQSSVRRILSTNACKSTVAWKYKQVQHSRNRPIGHNRESLIMMELNNPQLWRKFKAGRMEIRVQHFPPGL